MKLKYSSVANRMQITKAPIEHKMINKVFNKTNLLFQFSSTEAKVKGKNRKKSRTFMQVIVMVLVTLWAEAKIEEVSTTIKIWII